MRGLSDRMRFSYISRYDFHGVNNKDRYFISTSSRKFVKFRIENKPDGAYERTSCHRKNLSQEVSKTRKTIAGTCSCGHLCKSLSLNTQATCSRACTCDRVTRWKRMRVHMQNAASCRECGRQQTLETTTNVPLQSSYINQQHRGLL